MGPGLPQDYGLPEYCLEVRRVVVLESADGSAGGPGAIHDGGVVEGVRDDQIAAGYKGGDGGGIGIKAHVEDEGILRGAKRRAKKVSLTWSSRPFVPKFLTSYPRKSATSFSSSLCISVVPYSTLQPPLLTPHFSRVPMTSSLQVWFQSSAKPR